MNEQHPITPPPELVQQLYGLPQIRAIEKAFEAGANEELEACIAWFDKHIPGYELVADRLRAARRSKPPSLKEQGLQALEALQQRTTDPSIVEPLRRALEALPDD